MSTKGEKISAEQSIIYRETRESFYLADSLEHSQSILSKEDLDNLFGSLYEEYYVTRTPEVSNDFAVNTLDNEDTPSSSLIVSEEDEAPQIVTSSEESIANEATTLVSTENPNEQV
nr:hypothetical protein [Tanacetum cinerariifolium]